MHNMHNGLQKYLFVSFSLSSSFPSSKAPIVLPSSNKSTLNYNTTIVYSLQYATYNFLNLLYLLPQTKISKVMFFSYSAPSCD